MFCFAPVLADAGVFLTYLRFNKSHPTAFHAPHNINTPVKLLKILASHEMSLLKIAKTAATPTTKNPKARKITINQPIVSSVIFNLKLNPSTPPRALDYQEGTCRTVLLAGSCFDSSDPGLTRCNGPLRDLSSN